VPVPSQKIERSRICVLWVSILSHSMILIFYFGIYPTDGIFCFLIGFMSCSDSVVFMIYELFWQCGIFDFLFFIWLPLHFVDLSKL